MVELWWCMDIAIPITIFKNVVKMYRNIVSSRIDKEAIEVSSVVFYCEKTHFYVQNGVSLRFTECGKKRFPEAKFQDLQGPAPFYVLFHSVFYPTQRNYPGYVTVSAVPRAKTYIFQVEYVLPYKPIFCFFLLKFFCVFIVLCCFFCVK